MDQYTDYGCCQAVYTKRTKGGSYKALCKNRAGYHYLSTTGEAVKLCGRHSGSEAHRWKNPRPINESLR